MWCPDIDDILVFHSKLVARTGGIDGVRSLPLIESALYRFHSSFGGEDVYPSIEEKAAAVACGLIQNHGFLDGNKRIGTAIFLLILRQNGVLLQYTQQELIEMILSIACSKSDIPELVAWIHVHRIS